MLSPTALPLLLILLGGGTLPGEGGPWPSRGTRPPRETPALQGRVVVHTPAADQPLAFAHLRLLRAGAEVASTSTDRQGAFKLVKTLAAGPYQLQLDTSGYEGQLAVVVGGRPLEVTLFARRR
jgi:hypothetical protein